MKTVRSFLFFMTMLFTLACDKEPMTYQFLTVDVGFVDVNPANELWIFASDENGQLIDLQKMKRGTNYLKSVREDLISVDLTIVDVFEGNHHFTTYNDVTTDRTLKVNTFNPVFQATNTVDLILSNYNEGGDPYYHLAFSGGFEYSGDDTRSFSNGEFKAQVGVYESPGKFLISGYRGADAVYSLTTGVKTRLVVKLDFNNFEPVQNLVTINDASGGNVVGHSREIVNGGRFMNHIANPNEVTFGTIQLGHIPGFDYYSTTIHKITPLQGYWTSYLKVGAPVTGLTWPNASLTVNDRTQQNFNIDFSLSADAIKAYSLMVKNSTAAHWTVYGSGTEGGIRPNVPPMFLARLNISSKEEFHFFNGEIISSGGTYTHRDVLEEKLYDGAPKTEYEYFKFYF